MGIGVIEGHGGRLRVAAVMHGDGDGSGDRTGGAQGAEMVAGARERGPRAVFPVAGRAREAA